LIGELVEYLIQLTSDSSQPRASSVRLRERRELSSAPSRLANLIKNM
jgi:hypothetical protein